MTYELIESRSARDRASHYGDGVFTTALVSKGEIQLLPYHQRRLNTDALSLSLPPVDGHLWVEAKILAGKLYDGVLKIVLSAGVGGRGYQRPDQLLPNAQFFTSSFPEHYTLWKKQGVDLCVSDVTLSHQPILAGIKHLNRLEQVLIKREFDSSLYHDALVLDSLGHVVETSSANVFICTRNQTWVTPSLSNCGVKGVMRQKILDIFATNSIPCEVRDITLEEVKRAECLVMCNALMGIVTVRSLDVKGEKIVFNTHNFPDYFDSVLLRNET